MAKTFLLPYAIFTHSCFFHFFPTFSINNHQHNNTLFGKYLSSTYYVQGFLLGAIGVHTVPAAKGWKEDKSAYVMIQDGEG